MVFFGPTLLWLRTVPRRYEEEINEILHKFDDWPPPNERRRPHRTESPRRAQSVGLGQLLEQISPPQIMGIGLLVVLAGVLMHFGAQKGMGVSYMLGTYATALGALVLLAGYLMAVVRGGSGGLGRRPHVWRGEVIDLRPANRGLAYWWWRLRRRPGR